VRRLVFSPNDDTTAGIAIHYVRPALARWEPRIDVLAIDATSDPESPERLDILLEYRVRATNRGGSITYPLELGGRAP
jgi:phage baseplate assembly protein W